MTLQRSLRCVAAFVVSLSAALTARAQDGSGAVPARVNLTQSSGPGAGRCAGAAELEAAVEERLGRSVFAGASEADLLVEVRAARRGREFVIDMHLFDRSRRRVGQRRLTTRARHCSALDDSLALVLSLAADVTRDSLGPPASDDAASAPVPVALETPLEVPAPTHAPREPVRVRPGIGVDVGVGLMPSVSAGLHAELELWFPSFWPVSLRAAVWRDQRLGSNVGADFSVQTLQIGVCPGAFGLGEVELLFCVEQLLGRQHTEGFGFDRPDINEDWLAAFGPAVLFRYWLGHSFVSAQGSLLVPAVQRRYFYQDGTEFTLHETPWVLGQAGITAGFEL